MTHATRIDWKAPLALLLLSAIPVAAGIARLGSLADAPEIGTASARFVAAPLPVLVHIVSASLFPVLGSLQFSATLRQRSPRWQRFSGRMVVVSGIFAARSGLWMTVFYPIPSALQGDLLYAVRVLVGMAMLLSIVKSVAAVMAGDIAMHRVWMLLIGSPSMLQRDLLMSLAWLINLLVAHAFLSPFFKRFAS
jgi:uncharacterized membrane protein